jgi:hypothetical protein
MPLGFHSTVHLRFQIKLDKYPSTAIEPPSKRREPVAIIIFVDAEDAKAYGSCHCQEETELSALDDICGKNIHVYDLAA